MQIGKPCEQQHRFFADGKRLDPERRSLGRHELVSVVSQ